MPDVKYTLLRGDTSGIASTPLEDGQILFDKTKGKIAIDAMVNNVLTRIDMSGEDVFCGTTDEWTALTDAEKSAYTYVYLTDDFEDTSVIDDELSPTSPNAVQNKVIYAALGDKVDKVTGKGLSTNDYADADKAIVDGVEDALDAKVDVADIGVAGGVAELDANGKVPSSQLPSFVDDVKEGYLNSTDGKFYEEDTYITEITPEADKIYVDKATNITYRWSGSAFVAIGSDLALGETSSTAYRGDRGKAAYDHATDANKVSTATASGLYKVAVTAEGHIAGLTAVTKEDITALGIPGSRFVGTTAEWNALTTEQQNAYEERVLTDDSINILGVDDTPTSGSVNLVTSGGIYTALQGKQDKLIAGEGIAIAADGKTISADGGGELEISDTEWGEIGDILGFAKVFGAEWNGTSTTAWTRTDDSASFADPVPYVDGASSYGSPFDSIMPWAGMTIEERTGGTMVKIPKFWYKIEQTGVNLKVKISNVAKIGYNVSPAHMDRDDGNGERDVVYIGRYHCSSTNYKSITGATPKGEITRSTARIDIHNLGANIWQSDFAMRFTIWLLYIVEFADWNSQAKIGYGCGNNSGIEVMGYTDSMPYHTGTTQPSRTTYGLGTQYRNIEGLWDNVFDWCDGCYYDSNGLNIILNPNDFSDSSGGIFVGTLSNGYPSKFNVKDISGTFEMFVPTETGGSNSTYSCDAWYFDSVPCLFVGGNYSQNNSYGLFYVSYVSADRTSPHRSCRLMELPTSA